MSLIATQTEKTQQLRRELDAAVAKAKLWHTAAQSNYARLTALREGLEQLRVYVEATPQPLDAAAVLTQLNRLAEREETPDGDKP